MARGDVQAPIPDYPETHLHVGRYTSGNTLEVLETVHTGQQFGGGF